jgi:hypothetical protein
MVVKHNDLVAGICWEAVGGEEMVDVVDEGDTSDDESGVGSSLGSNPVVTGKVASTPVGTGLARHPIPGAVGDPSSSGRKKGIGGAIPKVLGAPDVTHGKVKQGTLSPKKKRAKKQKPVSSSEDEEVLHELNQTLEVLGNIRVNIQKGSGRQVTITPQARQEKIDKVKRNLKKLEKATNVRKWESETFLKVVLRANTICQGGIAGWLEANGLGCPNSFLLESQNRPGVELNPDGDLSITIPNGKLHKLGYRK